MHAFLLDILFHVSGKGIVVDDLKNVKGATSPGYPELLGKLTSNPGPPK